nr:putative uncharacterized protein DDB_G0291608 [Procambarus clarkii]
MQSSGLVLWLVALACACDPCLASSSGTGHQRPRNTLLALVRAATALHHHPPAAHPPQIPALPANALLEYPHLYRRHHVAPNVPPGPILPAGHRHYEQAEQQPPADADEELLQEEQQQEEQQERRRAWGKRGGQQQQESDAPVSGGAGEGQQEQEEEAAVAAGLQQVGASIATNFLRHARSGPRPYDVPRIGESSCSLYYWYNLPPNTH